MGGAPLVIAHRGAAAEAPENTIEAFDLSVFLGADALELDVQQAGDGTLVVIHDSTVDRTTEADGPVAGFGGAELERLGVPALEEVLERYGGVEITVDVKASCIHHTLPAPSTTGYGSSSMVKNGASALTRSLI